VIAAKIPCQNGRGVLSLIYDGRTVFDVELMGISFYAPHVLAAAWVRAWLVKITNAVCQHWQRQNMRRRGRSADGGRNDLPDVVSLVAGS
jgi:hypothetical protein